MIETETTSPHRNPVPWLTPMVVMWGTVIIVIALIVLGTWLNKRKAEFDTHEAREKFDAILRDAKFTPQQAQALTNESDEMLANSGVGIARREAATRWFHRMEQSLACVAIQKKCHELYALLRNRPGGAGLTLWKQWDLAMQEVNRLIYAVDRHDVDPEDPLIELDEFITKHSDVTATQITEFAADCRTLADKEKTPQNPPAFDLYDSLRRGIIESKDDEPIPAESEKAAQR